MVDFAERVASIGALADPLRRDLYLYVCAQSHPVGRDEAADALNIPRHKAKFHLDRLETDGLVDVEFARLTGRSGPGAGRPSKLYRRAQTDIAVSLPGREYELAGQFMADAIAESARTGAPVLTALNRIAADHGRTLGQTASRSATTPPSGDSALQIACDILAEHGYEPHTEPDRVTLANCPFHTLAAKHTEMVCGMNLALIDAMVEEIAPGAVDCQLDPESGRCCVTLAAIDAEVTT